MIDGIPNQPLYLYQKDMMAMELDKFKENGKLYVKMCYVSLAMIAVSYCKNTHIINHHKSTSNTYKHTYLYSEKTCTEENTMEIESCTTTMDYGTC
jgi:hypothetical protein